ncbi:MAG TPA: FHA domain-containing protein, partial [Acidimicrobiales bacterium]|nr:FHA domain-containing protein [Acidimicrobiales bacterium]
FLEVLEPDEYEGQRYDLDDELTVGRSPGCAVPTTYDVYSSTLHARLFRQGDQLWVEDLGSTNGTFVNSERIAKATRLARGDLLQVGATVFEVTR